MTSDDDIDRLATDWVFRVHDGEPSDLLLDELDAWLEADSRHLSAFSAMETLARDIKPLLKPVPEVVDNVRAAAPADFAAFAASRRRAKEVDVAVGRPWKKTARALAAVVVLTVMGAAVWKLTSEAMHLRNVTEEASRYMLPDESRATLSAESEVLVDYQLWKREVSLIRGQAVFDVRADAYRSFIVRVGRDTFEAVGTRFAVRSVDDDRSRLIVEHGSVRVIPRSVWSPALRRNVERTEKLVSVGQVAEVAAGEIKVRALSVSDQEETAWALPLRTFANERLGDVVRRFNGFGGSRLVLAAPELAGRKINGSFELDKPEGLIEALTLQGIARVKERRRGEIVLEPI